MIQKGTAVNLGDPLDSSEKKKPKYIKTSRKGQELMDDLMEVGLIDSTQRTGKPFTRGSDQQKCNSLSEHTYDTQRSRNIDEQT